MSASSYDPDLLHDAIARLNLGETHLNVNEVSYVKWCQRARKWGSQVQPYSFQGKYTEILEVVQETIERAYSDVQAMRDSLANILRDVSDVDASSAVLARQIAAYRTAGNTTQQNY